MREFISHRRSEGEREEEEEEVEREEREDVSHLRSPMDARAHSNVKGK